MSPSFEDRLALSRLAYADGLALKWGEVGTSNRWSADPRSKVEAASFSLGVFHAVLRDKAYSQGEG